MIGEILLKKLFKPEATTPFSKILCICALLSPWRHKGLDHRVSQIWRVDLSLLGCSQSSRFPTAGQGERRLWERDCKYIGATPRHFRFARVVRFGFLLFFALQCLSFLLWITYLYINCSCYWFIPLFLISCLYHYNIKSVKVYFRVTEKTLNSFRCLSILFTL